MNIPRNVHPRWSTPRTTTRPLRSTLTRRPEWNTRHHPGAACAPDPGPSMTGTTATATRYLLAGLRLPLGWVFLRAFLDKLFGLGRGTPAANA